MIAIIAKRVMVVVDSVEGHPQMGALDWLPLLVHCGFDRVHDKVAYFLILTRPQPLDEGYDIVHSLVIIYFKNLLL